MTEEKKVSIGERMLQLRNQHHMTQENLAEQLGVSRQSISKWELDKTLPDVEKLIQLLELYQVSIDYLIKGKDTGVKLVEPVAEPETEGEEPSEGDEHQEDESAQKEAEEGELQKEIKFFSSKQMILMLCMLITGFLSVGMGLFTWNLWFTSDMIGAAKSQNVAYVDRIYEQYTKAEVSQITEAGDIRTQIVWLDVPGVRECDSVFCFEKEGRNKLYFEYYWKTLSFPAVVGIFSSISK